jgi:PIN domain nuclease of toxin-antitoxin system
VVPSYGSLDSHALIWLAEGTVSKPGRELIEEQAEVVLVSAATIHHRDPFDRMLIAQARIEGLTLASADPALVAYDVPSLPVSREASD